MLPPNTILNKDKTLFDSGIRSDTIVVFCGTPLSLRPEYCDCVVEYESKINYLPPDNSCTMENAHQSSGDNSPGSPSTERKASGPKKKKELPNFFKAIKK